jgi:hypothetical protein
MLTDMYTPTMRIANPESATVMVTVRNCREERHDARTSLGQVRGLVHEVSCGTVN